MMIYCKSTDTEVKFDDCKFHTLIIENKTLLRNITYSFYDGNPDDYFVFSKNHEPFEFNKRGLYIPSAVGFDINNKRLLTKINSYLEHLLADELYTEFYEIKNKLSKISERLVQISDFSIDCDYDISPKDIVKLFGVKLAMGDENFAETFIRYIQLAADYLGVSLITVFGLHEFFDEAELNMIFKTLLLSDICVLCIESTHLNNISQYEKVHIIDCDLCNI